MPYPLIAKRMQAISSFRVMEILTRAKQLEASGLDVVHMEVGEPDFPAPEAVVQAAAAALASGKTRYTPAAGIPELREAVAGYYANRFGVSIDPGRIVITPGASGALLLVLSVLLDPGDQVLLQDPGYPCNTNMISMLGATGVALPDMSDGFDASKTTAAITPAARVLMLATPANPTGEVIPLSQLSEVYTGLDLNRQCLVVDEIYQSLEYHSSPITTALALGESGLFVINSFSKFFGMTGFRLGWVVAPADYVEPIERLAQNLFLAPPTLAQHAALAAFSEQAMEELEHRRQAFARRRDLLHGGLRSLGFSLPGPMPGGAFYLYVGLNGLAQSGEMLSHRLLEEAQVAITPGIDFGSRGTHDHVRFAYTTDEARIELGLERIRGFIESQGSF